MQWCTTTCGLHGLLITDYQKRSISADEIIPRYVSNGPLIILVFMWRKSIHFWRTYGRKKRFLHFRSQWPWPFTFRPQICSPSYSHPGQSLH